MSSKKIYLEVLHEGAHWIPCEYMARVVESVAPDYGDALHCEKIITKEMSGAMRHGELTKSLGRPAPVPSIFIDGELVFDTIPSQEELKACLDQIVSKSDS